MHIYDSSSIWAEQPRTSDDEWDRRVKVLGHAAQHVSSLRNGAKNGRTPLLDLNFASNTRVDAYSSVSVMTSSYPHSPDSSLDFAPLTPLSSVYSHGYLKHKAQLVWSTDTPQSPTRDSRLPGEQHFSGAKGPCFYAQRGYAYDPQNQRDQKQHQAGRVIADKPINYMSSCLSGVWPYAALVARVIESNDLHANVVLQYRIRVVGPVERRRIVDVICARGMEMMTHRSVAAFLVPSLPAVPIPRARLGNWAFQRLLETSTGSEERITLTRPFRGRVFDLATNRYGCYVLQRALHWKEEKVYLLIVLELLACNPCQTLVDEHASYVWIKVILPLIALFSLFPPSNRSPHVMEASWTLPAPARLNLNNYFFEFFKHKWATLACHLRGSLVVQFAFNNLEENNKDRIVAELFGQGAEVFVAVTNTRGGWYSIQHILKQGSDKHRQMARKHLHDFCALEQQYGGR
ncbi:ARM repeat-containing protein [Mycena venus]|uniref:ARM repeat-containing protein n=1 Tax=Mycena venus TaxID=2733690 RepID=A0A8H6Z754_9AGAR|nr:ARM repeat-containing protein [Mycena venus]